MRISIKIRRFFVFSCALLGCLTLFRTWLKNNDPSCSPENTVPTPLTLPDCQPFIRNAPQYQVNFAHEAYPKSVPVHYNRSIDFACLNRSPSPPLILLWNDLWPNPFIEREGTYLFKVCNFDVHLKLLHNTTIKIETIKNMHTLL
jgi:hypothetical protein